MGNCTAVIQKRAGGRAFGSSKIAVVSFSASYATGGDTVPLSIFRLTRLTALNLLHGSITTPSGHHVEVIRGATEFAAPKLRVRNVTTGAEIANATDLSGESLLIEPISIPYK